MYMILFVLNDPDCLDNVMYAWEEVGVGGITILPSTGLGRLRQKEGLRDDMPLMPSLEDFYHPKADINHTLFTIVESETLAHEVVQATERIVGSLDEPENGILVVLPAVSIHGLIQRRTNSRKKA